MQNLKRNINIGFRVTKEEKDMIQRKMSQADIHSLRAYLLKMAVDGHVVEVNLETVRECAKLLRNISNSINQIAKRVNETGRIYSADIEEIKTQLGEVWKQQDKIIKTITKTLEVA